MLEYDFKGVRPLDIRSWEVYCRSWVVFVVLGVFPTLSGFVGVDHTISGEEGRCHNSTISCVRVHFGGVV